MGQPQITPGSDGYLAPQAQTDYGSNPWSSLAQGHGATALAGVTQGQQNLTTQQQQMDNYTNQSAPYPTFPNSAGLGSQNAFGAAPSQGGSQSPTPASADLGATDPTSRGANPWSFRGEAMSR